MPRPSFVERKLADGVTLLHHRADTWKTEVFKVLFAAPLEGDLAGRSIASHLLRHGHSRLAGRTRVSEFCQDLYGAGFSSYVAKVHGRHVFVLRGSCVEARFLPGRLDPFAKLLHHGRQVVEKPYFATPRFPSASF